MPTVAVDAVSLHSKLQDVLGLPSFDLETFETKIEAVCFDFGLEYDGREIDPTSQRVKLRFDVAASRYDLLCLEGLAEALLTFLAPEKHPFPEFKWSVDQPQVTLEVDASVQGIRPYAIAAIFRDVTLDEASFANFIELQDKLHHNLCRKRTLVAIGTHNLDVIDLSKPITYKALPQKGGFKFVPLYQTEECDAERMFQLFENTHIKPYLHITRDSPLTPVIQDAQGRVLSVPPIINSEFSKMSKDTKNVFVEITATDLRKAEIVLDVLTCFMSSKTKTPLTVEPVRIQYASDHKGAPRRRAQGSSETTYVHSMITPSLQTEKFMVKLGYVKTLIGIPELEASGAVKYLAKMAMRSSIVDSDTLEVECPISRRDILHPCDIAEDIAIAIGYNNIARRAHPAVSLQTINNLSERVRRDVAQAGWNECLTFGLVSHANCFADLMRTEIDLKTPEGQQAQEAYVKELYSTQMVAARVSEPKTRDFEVIRPTLIPGLLNTLSSNQHAQLPIKIFEIGDCVVCDPRADNKIQHRRHLAALVCDNERSGLEEVHGLMDYVLRRMHLVAKYSDKENSAGTYFYKLREMKPGKELQSVSEGVYLRGRGVEVVLEAPSGGDITIGVMGVVHPEVLLKFNLPYPCSLFEISLDLFASILHHTELSAP